MHDFTPDLIEIIEDGARKGLHAQIIADKAGIGRRTLYEWLEKGDAGEEPFVRVSAAFRRASAEWTEAQWERAVKGDTGSGGAQWGLERRHPDIYGARSKLEVEHSGTVNVAVINFRDVPIEEVMALASGRPRRRVALTWALIRQRRSYPADLHRLNQHRP